MSAHYHYLLLATGETDRWTFWKSRGNCLVSWMLLEMQNDPTSTCKKQVLLASQWLHKRLESQTLQDAVSKLFTSYMRASPADIEDILLCMDRVVQSARA